MKTQFILSFNGKNLREVPFPGTGSSYNRESENIKILTDGSSSIQRYLFFVKIILNEMIFSQDTTWMEANLFDGDSSENRIPFDVLDSTEAETVYKNLLNQLNAEQNRVE